MVIEIEDFPIDYSMDSIKDLQTKNYSISLLAEGKIRNKINYLYLLN